MIRSMFVIFLLVLFAVPFGHAESWLQVSVDEIGAASPIRAFAAMPIRLATAVFQAVPAKYHQDCLDYGFDLKKLAQTADALAIGAKTTVESEGITVQLAKFDRKETSNEKPSFLVVTINDANVQFPLLLTGPAVKALTYFFEELQPVKNELGVVIERAKDCPPGRLLWCTDQYDTLEISLK